VGPAVDVRLVTGDDWALWRSLRLAALADAPSAFGSRLADWQGAGEGRWRARLALPGSHPVVAWLAGRPAGMACGVPGESPEAVEVVSMWVAPGGRGRGVGDALVAEVVRWATDGAARDLRLRVRAGNDPAIRLYERHGFVLSGEAPRTSPEEPLELVMTRPLRVGPGAPG
jgi:ribosomal protein S18 acetylase RimI-like enzyme